MELYDRHEERTGFQDSSDYGKEYDIQSDFVMVYGFANLEERIRHWKEHGYVVHLMTGVAWGWYDAYLKGEFDGRPHMDDAQMRRDGQIIWHGKDMPYIVPSIAFSRYLTENLKRAVDAGVEAIHLEEPELWGRAGYSETFRREWQIYYKEPWQDPESSADAQYKASKLKQYLYTRMLDRLCSEIKEYAYVKYNRDVRFYVPSHSLISYTQIVMVSPESALVDLPAVDGYIAQIWTGTARIPNTYRGLTCERVFETAYLEYGMMQELVRGSDRRMWFLHDPVEDNLDHTWTDYRSHYERTVVASLFQPHIYHYEVAPWPRRVFTGVYPKDEKKGKGFVMATPDDFSTRQTQEKEGIPSSYRTEVLNIMHALRDMKQPDWEWLTPTTPLGLLLSDTCMFQRIYPDNDPHIDDARTPVWDSFYGYALPLLKKGIGVRPIQLENVNRYPGYLDDYGVLALSYELMKPEKPEFHEALLRWVENGGLLLYIGDDSDTFHQIEHWWNRGSMHYRTPTEHLFELFGLGRTPTEGIYACGKGHLCVVRLHPRDVARDAALSERYEKLALEALRQHGISQPLSGSLAMRRGPYVIASVLRETGDDRPYDRPGLYVNLFEADLPVQEGIHLEPEQVGLYYDVSRIDRSRTAEILAASGRISDWSEEGGVLRFTFTGPDPMEASVRLYTRDPIQSVRATENGKERAVSFTPDVRSGTTLLRFDSSVDGVGLEIRTGTD